MPGAGNHARGGRRAAGPRPGELTVLGPGDLVALRLPPGGGWLPVLAGLWEAQAAAFPVDHRLAEPEVRALLQAARPTHVVDEGGLAPLPGGLAVEPDIALVVATSGTAGAPRLVELSRGAVEAAVRASAEALGVGPGDGWLCCLPPAHIGGLLVLLRGVLLGAPVVVLPGFDAGAVEAARGPSLVALVPTMLRRLLDAGADLARFRAVLVGGAGLDPDLRGRAAAAGARVVATYGLTESCGGVVYDGFPLAGTEVRVGEGGEVLLRGPTLMRRYRGEPRATVRALRGGWLHTGDGGSVDAEGRLEVHGRLDECIRSGGEKVWPAEVEAALRAHPGVADVAVAGRPDDEWGQRVVAFVVPTDPASPPSLEELRRAVGERLARFKAPREVVVVEALPRTASGKPRRRSLAGGGERPGG